MLNNNLDGLMCELLSIGVKNEPSIKFVTDFWDNPRISNKWKLKMIINSITLALAANSKE
jgi:hypothetical protein